ncbi:MAG: helix-turn-helix domain-containing protein [Streptosporangiales bacterium]|nr:helix-turn-helix domain-containing protein [Streptosporangiales bacterium]
MAVRAVKTQQTPATAPYGGRVQSVDRAVALLNAVSAAPPGGSTAAELAVACELNRATAWRLLATLEHHGMVERDPATNRYGIGFTISRLSTTAGVEGLARRAHHVLERLTRQTGETTNLAVAHRLELTYVDEVAPPVVLTARWIGRQVPIHATSAGKALLAWLPESELAELLAAPLAAYTETTRTDKEVLRAELARIRAQGYGVSIGEMEPHLNGVAAPVLDRNGRPCAVVSIWGPTDRVPEGRFPELGALVREGAAEIAATITS